jgi:two-component system NtrC family sensor kinase
MIYKIIICLSIIFVSVICYSQNKLVDSLKKVLATQQEDTSKVNTLNQLGRQFNDFYDLDNNIAGQYARQAFDLAEKLNFSSGKAFALVTIGGKLELQEKYKEARKKYDSAIYYYEMIGDKNGIADVYSSIASSYRGEQNGPEALDYTYRSLKLFEETGNQSAIALTYLSLGSHSIEEKDYKNAVKYLTYASDFFINTKYKEVVAVANSMLAEAEYEQGNYKKALQLDRMALASYFETGSVYNRGAVYLTIANIYEKMGDEAISFKTFLKAEDNYEEAIKNFMSAVDVYKTTNTNEFIFSTYNEIGKLYIKLHMLDSAAYYLNKSLDFHLKMDNDLKKVYINNFEHLYLGLSKLDSARGNKANAYEHYKMYVAYKDSNSTEERAKRLQQVKLQYEFDKKEAITTAEQGKRNAEERRTRNLQYTAIAVVLLIAIFLYWSTRQKQKAKIKIEQAYDNLKATQQQLIQSEKMASLGELTAGIAHEIQNPLNFVNNFSDVNKELVDELQEELKSGKIDDAIAISSDIKANEEKINHHGKRADAIVKGMLQHSRASSGQKELTDINILADEYLRLAYHGLRAKDKSFNAEIKTDFDNSIGKINIIPQDIGRVLLNLINNAFYVVDEKKKQIGDGYEPTVSVSTKKTNVKVEIKVADNGNGIPKKVLDKIFQPFFTTKPTGQGTGLGLSLSYDIVKAHSGELKVKTKEEEGSEFVILLPAN